MSTIVQIIDEVNATHTPTATELKRWVNCALQKNSSINEISICLVDKIKSAELNEHYRHKAGATNVLAFHYPQMPGIPASHDLILCSDLVAEEALAQNKPIEAHWAHLVVHGTLHLQGYDHETTLQAQEMERLETQLLLQLGFADPYSL